MTYHHARRRSHVPVWGQAADRAASGSSFTIVFRGLPITAVIVTFANDKEFSAARHHRVPSQRVRKWAFSVDAAG